MGTGGPFPGGKARPGRDADHSPPSSAEVVNEYELYILSPQAPPWRVEGLIYIFTYFTLIMKRIHVISTIQIAYRIIYFILRPYFFQNKYVFHAKLRPPKQPTAPHGGGRPTVWEPSAID
jgi:hypothetical protein